MEIDSCRADATVLDPLGCVCVVGGTPSLGGGNDDLASENMATPSTATVCRRALTRPWTGWCKAPTDADAETEHATQFDCAAFAELVLSTGENVKHFVPEFVDGAQVFVSPVSHVSDYKRGEAFRGKCFCVLPLEEFGVNRSCSTVFKANVLDIPVCCLVLYFGDFRAPVYSPDAEGCRVHKSMYACDRRLKFYSDNMTELCAHLGHSYTFITALSAYAKASAVRHGAFADIELFCINLTQPAALDVLNVLILSDQPL